MPKTLSPAEIATFRARLIDVAEQLFATYGSDGVTMRQLAEAMGVSSMTAYRYFEDKDAILAAVRTRAFNRFAEAMEEHERREASAPRVASKPATKRSRSEAHPPEVGRTGTAYLDFALTNSAAYRLMFDVNQPTFAKFPELVAAMERARLTMLAGLQKLTEEGRFRGDVELAAHAFWSALHGPVMLELAGLLWPPLNARVIATASLEALAAKFGIVEIKAKRARKRAKPSRR